MVITHTHRSGLLLGEIKWDVLLSFDGPPNTFGPDLFGSQHHHRLAVTKEQETLPNNPLAWACGNNSISLSASVSCPDRRSLAQDLVGMAGILTTNNMISFLFTSPSYSDDVMPWPWFFVLAQWCTNEVTKLQESLSRFLLYISITLSDISST